MYVPQLKTWVDVTMQTHRIHLTLRSTFQTILVASGRLVDCLMGERGTRSRVGAGDSELMSKAFHILGFPLVGHQVPYFLTEELLHSLSKITTCYKI